MTIVFKVSDNIKPKVIAYYEDKKKDKTPPYAVFQAMEADTTITLYESGKLMFQGMCADIDANIWIDMEKKLNNRIINVDGKEKKETPKKSYMEFSTIGSDEVGTGDYFGPIVVTATYVNTKDFEFLENLGVKDSKKLTDEKMLDIAPKIMKRIPYESIIIDNIKFNELTKKNINMNKMKAIAHNNVLFKLVRQNHSYAKIVVDQFCSEDNYYNYLREAENVQRHITFMTKAEDQVLSVACASIISRYFFLQEMDKLSDELHISLPKGAGVEVDKVGLEILEKYGFDELKKYAKINFKNTDKILNNR